MVGAFPKPGTELWESLLRLNGDGSVDRSFAPGPSEVEGRSVLWEGVAVQPGGAVLLGYWYEPIPNQGGVRGLLRFRRDGTRDPGFHPTLANPTDGGPPVMLQFVPQLDGGIIAYAQYSEGGATVDRLLRLRSDGSVDRDFQGQQTLGLPAGGRRSVRWWRPGTEGSSRFVEVGIVPGDSSGVWARTAPRSRALPATWAGR